MKVTIGELLGIAKQAKTLKWEDLAEEFKKAERINALKNTAVAQLTATFSTVLNAFAITKQIAQVAQVAKPIITKVVKVVGMVKNWAMAAELASDVLLLVKKLLIKLAMQGIEQIRDYILAIEIDLGNLNAKQLKALRDKIAKSLNDSWDALNESLKNFDPIVFFPDIEAFKNGVNSLATEIENTEWNTVLNAIGATIFELGQNLVDDFNIFKSDLDDTVNDDLNEIVYGDKDKTLTGKPPSYLTAEEPGFFGKTNVNLDDLQNPPPTNSGDLNWQSLVADDNEITREMMDAFEKTINDNINKLLGELFNSLLEINADTSDIEKDIYANNPDTAQEDIKALNNLKDGFLAYMREAQYILAKDALKGIFKLNDYVLRNILNLFLNELGKALKNRNAKIVDLILQYLQTLIDSGIVDPEIARQMLLDYLAILQQNLAINYEELYRKVLMQYLLSIFGSLSVDNEQRAAILVDKAFTKFYQYRRNFVNNIVEKIRRIRLQNDTIDEDYYLYSYDTLKSQIIDIISSILNTASSVTYSGEYQYDGTITYGNNSVNVDNIREELKSQILSAINAYSITVTENIPHPEKESIEEKINIFKSTMYTTIKQIIDDETIPETIWSEDEWLNVTDREKELLRQLMNIIFQDYKRRLLKVASDALFLQMYPNIKMLNPTNTQTILENYSDDSHDILMNKFYEDISTLIDSIPYNNDFEQFKQDMTDYLGEFILNYNFNLNHSIKLATLIKENEIEFIKGIIPIYLAT